MPKYSITNAQFSPFSFEEMIRPYQMATEKYEKQVDAFNKLAEDVNAVDYLAQSLPEDSPYRKQFNVYLEQFNKAGDTLSQGWSPDTASNLLNLRRAYHNALVPIQKADQTRTKIADAQNALRAKDPTIKFEIDATNPNSLSYFLDNPGSSPLQSYSLETVQAAAANQIKNLKERIFENRDMDTYGEEGRVLSEQVLSDEDKADIIAHPEKYPNITAVINDAINKSGLNTWSDEAKERELDRVMSGALDGVSYGMSAAKDPNTTTIMDERKMALEEAKANASIAASRASAAASYARVRAENRDWYMNPANPNGFLHKRPDGSPLTEEEEKAAYDGYMKLLRDTAEAKSVSKSSTAATPQGGYIPESTAYNLSFNKQNGQLSYSINSNDETKLKDYATNFKKYTFNKINDWTDKQLEQYIREKANNPDLTTTEINQVINNITNGYRDAVDIILGADSDGKMIILTRPRTYKKEAQQSLFDTSYWLGNTEASNTGGVNILEVKDADTE